MHMEKRYSIHPSQAKHFETSEIRKNFLVEKLFLDDDVSLCYSLDDRIIIGGIKPVSKEVKLEAMISLKLIIFSNEEN